MEYTDKILKVAETIVAGMKSLQRPANLPREQDNVMAAKRVSAAARGITPNIGVNKDFPFGPPLPTQRPNFFERTPVTPVRVPAAAAAAPAGPPPPPAAASAPAGAPPPPAAASAPAGAPGAPAGAPPPAPARAPPNPGTPGEQKKLLQTAEIQRITAANEKDPYGVLGLKPGASLKEIRKAYKQRALFVHPNKPLGNNVTFKKLQGAYNRLNPTNNSNMEGGRRRITVNRHLSRRSRNNRRTTYRR